MVNYKVNEEEKKCAESGRIQYTLCWTR